MPLQITCRYVYQVVMRLIYWHKESPETETEPKTNASNTLKPINTIRDLLNKEANLHCECNCATKAISKQANNQQAHKGTLEKLV